MKSRRFTCLLCVVAMSLTLVLPVYASGGSDLGYYQSIILKS